ncbi:MAG: hypothetical protein ACKOB2_04900 [Solirubrobacterales bacterium]
MDGDRKRPGQGNGSESGPKSSRRPVLTERQRREAREARRRKRRSGGSRRRTVNPLVAGVRATGRELARAFGFLGALLLAGLDALSPVWRSLGAVLQQVGRAVEWLVVLLGRALSATGRAIARGLYAADRVLTPARAVLLVAIGSAVLLGWSQFIEYRAVEIGQPGYAEVLDVATAPRTDGRTPIDEHSFILLAAAVVALVGAVLATGGKRPLAGLLVAAAGALAVAVGLLVDLPAGTEASEVAAAYSGAEAVLLAGFWLELAAGVGLACCGLLIAFPPRARREPAPTARRRRMTVAAGGAR